MGHLTHSLEARSFPQRFCFDCPSYPVSTSRLGKAEREMHSILICPVFPPNHILRSGNLADILGTSCSVITECQRIPKKPGNSLLLLQPESGQPISSSRCLREETAEGAAQSRLPGLFFELLSAPRRAGVPKSHTHKVLPKYFVGRCSPRSGNKFESLRRHHDYLGLWISRYTNYRRGKIHRIESIPVFAKCSCILPQSPGLERGGNRKCK